MNIQPSTTPIQQIQTGQPIYLSSSDGTQKSQIIQIANNGSTNQNVIYTNQIGQNTNGYYLIQPHQSTNNQFSILPTSSTTTMPSAVTNATQIKPITSQQPIFIQNNIKYQGSPRIIIQQPTSTNQVILPQQNTQSGQLYLNINNRIVPIQSVNIKQTNPSITTQNPVTPNSSTPVSVSVPTHTQTPQTQNNPQYVIVSNTNVNNQTVTTQNPTLSGEISDKMKQLEQIQTQLKQYQQKILQLTNSGPNATQTVLTQAQIQAVLSQEEQIQLQKLIVNKKTVENEIQQLKQKLLNNQNQTVTQPVHQTSSIQSSSQSTNKLQLLQQVTQKLNALRSSKTVTIDSNTGQQQLVLTHEEFDQMKKLIDLQNTLQNELKTVNETTKSTIQQQPPQPQITTTINLNELNLSEKLKLNDLINNQIEQLKQNMSTQTNKDLLKQMKDKCILLIKKQSELQSLIDKEKETSQISKQTPVKIRNVITQGQIIKTTSPQITTTTPLRTLVINNKDNVTTTSTVSITPTVSTNQILITLQQAINLRKQNFPNLQFKCLSFEELAQHGVITKDTDELTINLLKKLDDRASQVINREQLESFQKDQVKLAKKYLEQQQLAKQTIKTRISEQLLKDQKLATEPDFKTAFTDKTDAIKRLSRYHVFQKTYYEPTQQESEKFDQCFEQVSDRLLKIADAMKKRFNLLQLRSMQKEVSSSEETLLLKLYVDDLKQNIEQEKQQVDQKSQQQQQQQQFQQQQQLKPQIQIIKTDSPQTIRNLIKMSQSSVDSGSSTCLKRLLKPEDEDKTNKIQKLEPSFSSISTEKSESNTSLNQLSSSAYPSSSSSSFGNKAELKQFNGDLNDTIAKSNLDLDDYDDDDDQSNDDSVNAFDQYETFRQQNSNVDLNEDNSSSGLNNFSNLDDFILNEDDLAVQSILDF